MDFFGGNYAFAFDVQYASLPIHTRATIEVDNGANQILVKSLIKSSMKDLPNTETRITDIPVGMQ